MKKKHKFHKFLNTVVKSHGDIEEDKKEIENNVKKMLELFENKSEDISDRSDLVSLVNDIKRRYYALYGWHYGLIGKIQNKGRHRNSESRSGSSDSGSEDSSDEDGTNEIQEQKIVNQLSLHDHQSLKERIDSLSKRNAELEAQTTSMHAKLEENLGKLIEREKVIAKLEDELQTVRNSLKLLGAEIMKSKEQEVKLSLLVSDLQEENEVLMSAKKKTDNSIIDLKSEREMMMDDTWKLREENRFLKEEVEKKTHELAHLNHQIVLAGEEHETLRVEVEELKSSRDGLMSEKESLLFENQRLKPLQEAAVQQVSNLNDKLLMVEGDNNSLKSEVLMLSTHVHEANKIIKHMTIESGVLKEDISELHDTITDLNHQLKVKDEENYAVALKSSESWNMVRHAEERNMILSVEAEIMKHDNSVLLTVHENLKLELEGNYLELSKVKQALEAAESEMNSLREENALALTRHENLLLNLEGNNLELSNIKQALVATEFEKNSLIEEKTTLLGKINEGGMVIDSLKAQVEEIEGEKSQLQQKISNLYLDIQYSNLQFIDVQNALVEAAEDRKALASENLLVESKLQEVVFTKDRLQAELRELNQKNSILLNKLEEAKKDMAIEIRLLKDDISTLHDTITDLNHQLKVKDEENYAKSSESRKAIQHAEEITMILSVEAERMKHENSVLLTGHENLKLELEVHNQELSKLKQVLEETESEMNSLREGNTVLLTSHENLKLELEDNNIELSKIKQALEATEFDRCSLIEEKSALLSEINESGMVIDDLKAQIGEESQLQMKISNLNIEIQSANIEFTDVKNALVAAEEEKKALASENLVLESKLQEAEFMNEKLQAELRELNQKNSFLLDEVEETKKDKEDISKLHDTITDLNHQLKIKDDKVVILSMEAERMKSENSMLFAEHENLKLEIEGYDEELSKLKEGLEATDSETKSLREENSLLLSGHENMKLELEGNNQELSKLKQALESTEFERNSLTDEKSTLLSEISEGGMVIDGLKAQIEEAKSEKSKLQMKIGNLDLEIQYALAAFEEEKSALISEKSIIESKLQEAEFTEQILQAELGELNIDGLKAELHEKRMLENEANRKLAESEEKLKEKDEEKREAIRQLCLLIEYHWENRNYLARSLSAVLRGRGAS